MPIKHAAEKAMRQTEKRTARNTSVLRSIESLEAEVRKLVAAKSNEAKVTVLKVQRAIDKAVQRHIVAANTGARWKSRLMTLVK